MCGIAGFMGQVENRADVIRNMTEVITHRGPDSDGFFTDDNISMGFRRLSIIDLGAGHQPIYNEDKSLVLTFNGEIYNYKDLRKELIAKGHKFYTDTDSEVLVHGFEEWKEDMLPKLRGMFGFAIYNTKDNSLFIARDFFGIKPMHYTQIGNDFVYASEIKSILEYPKFEKKFNRKALDSYLSFQYAVPPETFFEGVYCLMPGHYLWYKDGEVETTRYFEARFNPNEEMTEEEAVDKIEKVFENSVNAHKIADVEVGCFLSSGVDSSYVSTYFADQKTFTVGFDFGEKYNEISWAKNLSEKIGVEHHTHLISSEEFWDAVPTVQYHMDQPLADPSCIALYFVSRLASHYVKVVLSGEGADELFGGYTCYNDPRVFKIYQTIVPHCIRKAIRAICRKLPDIKGRDYLIRACDKLEERYIGNAFMYDYKQKQELLKDPSIATRPQDLTRKYYYRCRKYDDVTKMQYLDINMWMVGDILLKADRMSMANSLELRVPFLDKEVFKVASSLPTKLRCNKHNTKYAMRKAAVRHMPEATAEKEKLGFPVPTRVWLREEKYYNVVKTKFKGKTAEKFFNTDVLVSWLDSHFSGKEDNSRRVWTIYVFLVWYDIYFDEDSEKVEKPVNHLDELKAVAEARREKQIDAPGEVIMAAAEEIDENYDAPNFGVDNSKKIDESAEKAEESVKEESAEDVTEKVEVPDDGNEPAIVEPEEEPEVKEEPKKEEYVNISNPEDNEIYDAPKKPSTPQEQMQMAIDSIEKRSKYLDEPNVISDEAVDNIVNSISFFGDEDEKSN
ncbi:asparagine synthase (glutamine-hydrolyzing) [Ruminococcus bromii]|uniref:asparagine synthase (glutamine-hydrolyzing) n=1 Tax=Ruminococcus bromii TaxID=40518 RepID=UPI003119687F